MKNFPGRTKVAGGPQVSRGPRIEYPVIDEHQQKYVEKCIKMYQQIVGRKRYRPTIN